MSGGRRETRLFEPPRRVWVREVDRAGREWAVEGLQWAWVPLEEWGSPVWVARVTTGDETAPRIVPASAVRVWVELG